MEQKQCLIFDMDGTLWDATKGVCAAYNEKLEQEKGWKQYLTQEQIEAVQGMTIDEIADAFFPQLDQEERMELVLKCMDHENEYLSQHGGTLYPDVVEGLSRLSGRYTLMIVTNAQDGYVEAMFAAHGLSPYFKDFETYGKTRLEKGENLKLIMKRNGFTPKQCVYIGDTQKDLQACELAGLDFIYAAYGFGEASRFLSKTDSFKELETLFL